MFEVVKTERETERERDVEGVSGFLEGFYGMSRSRKAVFEGIVGANGTRWSLGGN